MRRRLSLKVLYWPAIASTSIIVLLLCVGPFDPWIRPIVGRFLPAGRLLGPNPRADWMAGGQKTGTVNSHESRRLANRRPPRSLLNRGLIESRSSEDYVPVRDASYRRDGSWHYPSVADLANLLPSMTSQDQRIASAKLHAPRITAAEELAGLDLDIFARDSQSMGLLGGARVSVGRSVDALLVGTGSGRLGVNADALEDRSEYNGLGDLRGLSHERLQADRGYVGDDFSPMETESVRASRSRHGLGGGWPDMPQLIADLRQVAVMSRPQTGGAILTAFSSKSNVSTDLIAWHNEVDSQLTRLRSLPSIAATDSMAILSELGRLADEGYQAAEAVADRQAQVACLRAAHSLARRVSVWNAVHQATLSASSWVGDVETNWADRDSVSQMIRNIESDSQATADPAGWARFMLLDEIAVANDSADLAQRRLIAQRFLSRIDWFGLTDSQRIWLQRDSVDQLATSIRRWAVMPVDYASLLGQIERQESDAIDLGGIDVARATQSLRFASSPDAATVAQTLNTYYRNANIRVAVSSDLIERLIPEVDSRIQPVRQRILGSDVRGQSFVDSKIAVRLTPSPDSWRLQLETSGNVHSKTSSRSGLVSIRNHSDADFASVTPLEITRLDAQVGDTGVDVRSQTRVRGIETDFDAIPLVSTLVREIAMSRYQQLAPIAKQIQNGQIRRSVGSEVDKRVNEQIDAASAKLVQHLVGPLNSLGLSPMVVDMQTTEERLTARYRIGGDWQLAAFTPRPRAPSDSLLSVQVHQSVLNNTLETALPAGQSVSILTLVDELKTRFAVPDQIALADEDDVELSADTIIHFAPTRPITVEIEDDAVWITLRIMRLYSPGSVDLRRFVVRAVYKCEVDGMSASLVRYGHLRISGPGMSMRDRLPARAIFNKVFSTRRPLPLVPPALGQHPAMTGLAISQLELRDGWIGLAIGPATGDRVATNASLPIQ
jgi:hypothetical protein